jgi:hypothetical protein
MDISSNIKFKSLASKLRVLSSRQKKSSMKIILKILFFGKHLFNLKRATDDKF